MNWPSDRLIRGRYRIDDILGRGGMGAVYRGYDEFLGRDVAIKLFNISANPDDFQRQEDEVNTLASLNHHGLVTLFDAAVDRTEAEQPRLFFVMELVEGLDLKRTLVRETLSARQIAQVGYDLAEALQYVHGRGVVHRDVKPANILIVDYQNENKRTRAKLTDFGIAVRPGIERIPDDGATTGTVAYLSPEQVERTIVGPPSDVYSLGLVLIECFSHHSAFSGDPTTAAMERLIHDPRIPEELDDDWRLLLRAMTSRRAADRPSSDELVEAMRQMVIAETGRHRVREDAAE